MKYRFLSAILLMNVCRLMAQSSGPSPFTSVWTYPAEVTSSVAIGDFDHDGRLDYAYTDNIANTLTVFVAGGSHTYPVGVQPDQIINVGGNLVTKNRGDNSLSILLGYGDPFTVATPIHLEGVPRAITTADFNHDGIGDLAVVDCLASSACKLEIYMGTADGQYILSQAIALPGSASRFDRLLVAADFNSDFRPDLALVTSDSKLLLFSGTANGRLQFVSSFDFEAGTVVASMAAAPFGSDLAVDLAVRVIDPCASVCGYSNSVKILHKAATGLVGISSSIAVAPSGVGGFLVAADVNEDQFQDIVTVSADYKNPSVQYALGRGDGTLSSAMTFSKYPGERINEPTDMLARDINFDSRKDIVISTSDAIGDDYAGIFTLMNNSPRANCSSPDARNLAINLCAPFSTTAVLSPVSVQAVANSPAGVKRVEIWVDGVKQLQSWSDQIWRPLSMTSGSHRLVAVAYDQNDSYVISNPVHVNVK